MLVQNAADGVLKVLCHNLTRATLGCEVESLSLARALLQEQSSRRTRGKMPKYAAAANND